MIVWFPLMALLRTSCLVKSFWPRRAWVKKISRMGHGVFRFCNSSFDMILFSKTLHRSNNWTRYTSFYIIYRRSVLTNVCGKHASLFNNKNTTVQTWPGTITCGFTPSTLRIPPVASMLPAQLWMVIVCHGLGENCPWIHVPVQASGVCLRYKKL